MSDAARQLTAVEEAEILEAQEAGDAGGADKPPPHEEPAETTPDSGESASDSPAGKEAEAAPRSRGGAGRWARRFVLLIVVPAVAVIGAVYWYALGGRIVTTENAYVKSNIVAVSTNLDGRVVEVEVNDNQTVAAGQVLFRLDPRPHLSAYDVAAARLAAVRQEVERRRAEYRQVRAEIAEARERVAFFRREAERQRELGARGVATRARLEEAEYNLASAGQAVNALDQKSATVLASLGGDPNIPTEEHPLFREAAAELEQAELRLGYTEVSAPVGGVITQMRLQPGEWVEEGRAVFGLIETDTVWVEANLKETQLTHVREGQSVSVRIDAYPGQTWEAQVASISPATGAEFAILPPQNATGNWVKVVQRLPVRIGVEQEPDKPPLRAGMTATVRIDTEYERDVGALALSAINDLRAMQDGFIADLSGIWRSIRQTAFADQPE